MFKKILLIGALIGVGLSSLTVANKFSIFAFEAKTVEGQVQLNMNTQGANIFSAFTFKNPLNLTAKKISPNTISLSWTAPTYEKAGYVVQRSLDQHTWTTIAKPETSTTYVDTPDTSSMLYFYRVYALIPSKVSNSATISNVVGDVNLDGKVDLLDLKLVAVNVGRKTGDVNFNPNADVNGDGIVDQKDAARIRLAIDKLNLIADLNGDGLLDVRDVNIVQKAIGTHVGDYRYSVIADVNGDGFVDQKDGALVRQAMNNNKLISDLNGDGKLDVKDIRIVANAMGTHIGDNGYSIVADVNDDGFVDPKDGALIRQAMDRLELIADVTGDGQITSADSNYIKKYLNTKFGDRNYNLIADLNSDGFVDQKDLALVSQVLVVQ